MGDDPVFPLRQDIALAAAGPANQEEPYFLFPAFRDYARRIFDLRAAGISASSKLAYRGALRAAIDPIIEDILPDESLWRAQEIALEEDGSPEHFPGQPSVSSTLDDGLYSRKLQIGDWPLGLTEDDWTKEYEVDLPPLGMDLARAAAHGVWEREVPGVAQLLLRFPHHNRELRVALRQELEKQVYSWLGSFRIAVLDEEPVPSDLPSADVLPVALVEATGAARPSTPASGKPASWEDVQIFFLSDLRVQIVIDTQTESLNYAELGFADGRNQKAPRQAWMILRKLAEANGCISETKSARDWPRVEKQIQEIRKRLRDHFELTGDPIPFGGREGYRAKFKIACGPSYEA